MKAQLYNLQADSIGDITLPVKVFGLESKPQLISLALRVYRSNLRSSHAKVKDRGEVAGTTKKMWAQKGTGRARHGSAKAGIFVGGGSVHGPQGNQNYKLSLNKKVKKTAFNHLLSDFAKEKLIIVIDQFKPLPPKTKDAWNFFEKLEKQNETIAKAKKIGIITSKPLENVKLAFANIPGINYFSLKSLNLINLAGQNTLIFSKKAIQVLGK